MPSWISKWRVLLFLEVMNRMQCCCNDLTLQEKGALRQNQKIIVKSSLVSRSDESDAMLLQWSYIAGKGGFASKLTQKCDPWSSLLLEPGLTEVKVEWWQLSFHIFMVSSFDSSSTLLLIQKSNPLKERFFCAMILQMISITLMWCWWAGSIARHWALAMMHNKF